MHADLAKRTITPAQARRAVYLDVEGRKDEPPVLLGTLHAEGKRADQRRLAVRHDVVAPSHAGLGGRVGMRGVHRYELGATSLRSSLDSLIRRAVKQDRVIVSWSRHDLEVVHTAGLPDAAVEAFERQYREGKATAKRWRSLLHPDLVVMPTAYEGTHKLSRYLDFLAFPVPTALGPGRTGANLGKVEKGLQPWHTIDDLTEARQRAWREVLGHNVIDLFGLRHVVLRAATDLELLDLGLVTPDVAGVRIGAVV